MAFFTFRLKFPNDNFDNFDNRMVRPCKTDTVEFQRKLSADDRKILLAAGAGDLTRGFRNMLSIYAALHNAGFRWDDDVIRWVYSENDSHLD